MALIDLTTRFQEIQTVVGQVEFADIRLPDEFKVEFDTYIAENAANGYAEIKWAEFSAKIITSSGKSIYLPNYWFYLASELAGYLEGLEEQRNLFRTIFNGQDLKVTADSLKSGSDKENIKVIQDYFTDNKSIYSKSDYQVFERFVSDYPSWGGGKTIDRDDFFVSAVMKAGNLLAETQSAVAEIAKLFFHAPKLRRLFHPIFISQDAREVDGGEFLNELISENVIGQFVYKLIEFLINNNQQDILFKYLVERNTVLGSYNLEYEKYRLTSFFRVSDSEQSIDDLSSGDKLRFFKTPFVVSSKYYYLSNQWTDGVDSRLDIQTLFFVFNELYDSYQIISNDGRYVLTSLSAPVSLTLPKPFLLLAGISGTGKTRFVRKQALGDLSNYKLVPVRPDWHEPSDLLGYVSRLGVDGASFIVTDTLKFIVKAWLTAVDPDSASNGKLRPLEEIETYWLCLDEMNLAPVEQYFADYLSILETRNWKGDEYLCDPIIEFDALASQIGTGGMTKLRKDLGLEANGLWNYFEEKGIPLPPNLVVAGTVNMDETTHGFSRKVIDRAFTIDFGEFYPNDYSEYFYPSTQPIKLGFPRVTHITEENELAIVTADPDGALSLQFLEAINSVLRDTPFQLAYRALNELFLALVSFKPKTSQELKAVWDDFLMSKVLPRIDGDAEKLSAKRDIALGDNLLDQLVNVLETQFEEMWSGDRPDLLRENLDGSELLVYCRSARKLKWMQALLISNGFTSFWP